MEYKEIAYGDPEYEYDREEMQEMLDNMAIALYLETGLDFSVTVISYGNVDYEIVVETDNRVIDVFNEEEDAITFFNRLIDGSI